MRRFILCLVLSLFVTGQYAWAQENLVYNSNSSSSSAGDAPRALYNGSSASSASSGPISIRNLVRGKPATSYSAQYSSRSYGYSNSNNARSSALSMTPQQIKAKQASDKARYEKRKRAESKRKQAQERVALQKDKAQMEATKYRQSFQDNDDDELPEFVNKKRKVVYNPNKEESVMPSKIFNSLY